MKRFLRHGCSLLLAAGLLGPAAAQQFNCYTASGSSSQANVTLSLNGSVGDFAAFFARVSSAVVGIDLVDSNLPSASVIDVMNRMVAAPGGGPQSYGMVTYDSSVLSAVAAGQVYARVTVSSGVTFSALLQLDPVKQYEVELFSNGSILYTIFDAKTVSNRLYFRKVAQNVPAPPPPFNIIAGSPQAPGVLLESIDLASNGDRFIQIQPASMAAICAGNAFAQLQADPSATSAIVELVDEKRVKVSSSDGSQDNAIGFFTRQPGNMIAGTIRTGSFPSTVLAVNVYEGGTFASYGPTFLIAPNEYLLPPVVSLTPAMIQSYEQNNMIVEIVTSSGSFQAPISNSEPPPVLEVGTPGLNGVVPFLKFTTEALIGYGYTLQLSDADAGAPAIPILGFELHDPPLTLANFGLDDAIWVKLLTTLPLALLDSSGGAVWQQTLPNDTTFTGLPLFSQVAVLSGLDGLSMSTLSATTVGPN